MFGRFIAWWVRNSSHIGPVASCVSALAALLSVYMVTRTFRQARKDRAEELESRHPRFVISEGSVRWITQLGGDHSIKPFYELWVEFKNVKESSAKQVKLKGAILDKEGKVLKEFSRQPTDYIEKDGVFTATTKAEGKRGSSDPYYVTLSLEYRDPLTGKKHPQTLWRKFYMQGEEGQPLELVSVDRDELKELTEPVLKLKE